MSAFFHPFFTSSGGGLEIPISLIVKKGTSTSTVFKKMEDILEEYYVEPNKIVVLREPRGDGRLS